MMKPVSYFIDTRGDDCQWCGARTASHRHHIYHRIKGCKQLDEEENILWVCTPCHQHKPDEFVHNSVQMDSREGRLIAFQIQKDFFGEEHVIEWNNSLPNHIKEGLNG